MVNMIAKLINGRLHEPTTQERMIIPLEDGCTITNPTEETMIELLGYKPVVQGERPETPEGYYLVEAYTEEDDKIIRGYELKEYPTYEPPVYEEPPMSEDDIFTAILLGKDV